MKLDRNKILYYLLIGGTNLINFAIIYLLMPYCSAVLFLVFVTVFPVIYNVFFVLAIKIERGRKVYAIVLSFLTVIVFTAFAYAVTQNGYIEAFASYNELSSSDGIVVEVDTDIYSISNILFIGIEQLVLLLSVCFIKEKKGDRSS